MIGRKKILGIAMVVSCCIPWRSRATEFASPSSYAVGTTPVALVAGDFNGDGKLDLAIANSGSDNVSILLGNGDGTFQTARNFAAGLTPNSIAAGDFNGDGKLDLVVFQSGDGNSTAGIVAILLGNGDGTLQAPKTTILSLSATNVVPGDFNNDKKLDLIEIDGAMSQLLLGNGDGTFQPGKSIPNLSGVVSVVADFNNDGNLDVVGAVGNSVEVLLGKGDGTFQAGEALPLEEGFNLGSTLIADLNGDGHLDLIVNSQKLVPINPCFNPFHHCSTFLRHTQVFLGKGDGTFENGLAALTANAIAIADFNGDAKLDVLDNLSGEVLLLGKGDGSFASALPIVTLPFNADLAADLNGDKLADLIGLDSVNNAVVVSLNDSPGTGADLGLIPGSVPNESGIGQNLTYVADVLNEGPNNATNVTFTDTLPAGVTFVSAISVQGNCTQSHSTVICNIGSLSDAADAQITIVVTPTASASITNVMEVSAMEADLAMANNTASQTVNIVPVYTLTVSKTGNGTGTIAANGFPPVPINCGSACSAQYLSGSSVILHATAASGDFFTGWGGACSGTSTCAFTITSNSSVTAGFVQGDSVTVTLAGSGAGTVTSSDGNINCSGASGNCSESVVPGTQVTLQATPSGTSIFSGWSGACSGTDPNKCSVTLNSNTAVTATFNPPPDFNLTPAIGNLTLKAGTKVSEVISFSAQGGFTSTISLTCSVSGAAPTPTCSISPNSVSPGSNATLTVDASGISAMKVPHFPRLPNSYFFLLTLAALAFVFINSLRPQRRPVWLLATTAVMLSLLPVACGGGSGGPAPPVIKAYNVTVTATSGAIMHTTTITVTVD